MELWVKFKNKFDFMEKEQSFYDIISDYEGNDEVLSIVKSDRVIKKLPRNRNVRWMKTYLLG